MRAVDASARRSFADFQATSRLQTRSPGGRSAAADEAESGGTNGGGDRRRSASATLQRPAGRIKVLWEDPSAPSRSRSAERNSAGRKAAKKQSDKRSPRTSDRKHKQGALPQAARALVQRVVEWDTRLKAVAELDEDAIALQTAFRAACGDLLVSYSEAAKQLDVDRRLWQNWYRHLERVQRLEDPAARSVLDECSRSYLELVARLEIKGKNANATTETREAVQFSLQHSLVALGDVERYKQQHLAGKLDPATSADAWADAMKFYQRARAIAPGNGKAYNQLALVAARNKKFLEAAYLYARSLGCQHPFPSRENLMQSLKQGTSMSPLAITFPQTSGRMVGMRVVGILSKLYAVLSRSADLQSWRESLATVQAAMRALLSVEDLLNDKEYRDQVATALVQIIIVNLLLVHNAQSGGNPSTIAQDKLDFDASGLAELCALDLLFTIGASILQQLTAFLRATSDYRQLQSVGNALLPGTNALLQWLHLQDWPKGARSDAADLFYTGCTEFHFALPSSSSAVYLLGLSPGCDQELPEDLEVKGFLPLDYARERYSEVFPASPVQLPSFRNVKGRSPRGRAESPSSVSKKEFEVRMARAVGLCKLLVLMRSCGRLDKPLRTGATTRTKPARIDRLCLQCSNSSTFDGGACEFCGFEDDTFETSADSEEDGDDEIVLTAQYLRDVDLANEPSAGRHDSLYGSSSSQAFGLYTSEVTGGQQVSSPPDPSSFAAVMAIGSQYSEFQSGFQPDRAPSSQARSKCLIVLDAPNIAMRHGMSQQQFSSQGVRLAVDYFQSLGHRVVAFIPDYMLKDEKEQLAARRNQPRSANLTLDNNSPNVCKIPDDITMLRTMVQEGVLVPTPPQDYDDSYCIQYAGLHNGCVVTNDLFRDHVQNMEGPRERKEAMRTWLKAHQISFTWVRNEFLPNPDFRCVVLVSSVTEYDG